jgi:hypothetical protein
VNRSELQRQMIEAKIGTTDSKHPNHLVWAQAFAVDICLVARRFGVTSNPLFDSFFFIVLVGMMCLGVESSQLDNFVDNS